MSIGDDEEAASGNDSSDDFSVDPGASPSTVSAVPPTIDNPPDIQISPDQPDYEEVIRNAPPEPIPSPDQPVMRERTLDDEPPLRSGEEEAPDNPHVPEDEEEEEAP